MQALSHKEYGKLRNLYESVYAPKTETILEAFTDEDLEINFTDEYIEEQVEELFLECIEEGYSIDEVEDILTESIESSILLVSEDRYDSAVSASKANAQKPEVKRANRREALRKVGSAVKKVASGLKKGATAAAKGAKAGAKVAGKAAQGGVGLAARAVGTAQRAASAVKGAAKSGYERGRKGSSGSSSSSSGSGSDTSSSSSSSSSSSPASSSSSSSSDSGSSSSAPAPKKRKDGLLKRGLKKLVRGAGKAVSAAAGAVKAGADSLTDRARKEELEATGLFSEKEIEAIMEAEMIDENRAAMGRINKEYHRKKEAEAMAARARDPKVKRDLPKRKNDNPMYDPKSAGSSRVSGFKFTPTEDVEYVDEDSRRMSNKQHTKRVRSNIKSFGSDYTPPSNYDPDANRGQGEVLTRKQIEKKRRKALRQEEVEVVDENRRAARSAGGYKDDSKKQPDPSKDGFTGVGNMSIDAIRKMSARIEKEKTKKEEVEQVNEAEKPFPHEKVKAKQLALRTSKDPKALDRRMTMGAAKRRAKEAEETGGSQRDAGKGWYHARKG